MRKGLGMLVGAVALASVGVSCDGRSPTEAGCERVVTRGIHYAEVTLEERTPDYDPCLDSVKFEYYAWMRRNEAIPLRIRVYPPGGGEQSPKTIEFVQLDGGTVDPNNVFHPNAGSAKIHVRLDGVYYSNALYIAVMDSVRVWSVPSVGGTYDLQTQPAASEGSLQGVLSLADTGNTIRFEQCPLYDGKPPTGCNPSENVRRFAASFTGTICKPLDGGCSTETVAGFGNVDSLRNVNLCLGTGPPVYDGCQIVTRGTSRLTARNDSLTGRLEATACAGLGSGTRCLSAQIIATRRK